ncbi:MAG: hypothetical protein UV38_C0003G0066 [candidate division TM6 bacterium GW2011_GWE2_42_60]|nr:MAG: hypothetical protein UV38_C0003G0066 [candidate division TM6 bacterium GW2011_GWE2_42_60]HBY05453.1 hypothetical protein [Candidatus Dependentiae bacterium]
MKKPSFFTFIFNGLALLLVSAAGFCSGSNQIQQPIAPTNNTTFSTQQNKVFKEWLAHKSSKLLFEQWLLNPEKTLNNDLSCIKNSYMNVSCPTTDEDYKELALLIQEQCKKISKTFNTQLKIVPLTSIIPQPHRPDTDSICWIDTLSPFPFIYLNKTKMGALTLKQKCTICLHELGHLHNKENQSFLTNCAAYILKKNTQPNKSLSDKRLFNLSILVFMGFTTHCPLLRTTCSYPHGKNEAITEFMSHISSLLNKCYELEADSFVAATQDKSQNNLLVDMLYKEEYKALDSLFTHKPEYFSFFNFTEKPSITLKAIDPTSPLAQKCFMIIEKHIHTEHPNAKERELYIKSIEKLGNKLLLPQAIKLNQKSVQTLMQFINPYATIFIKEKNEALNFLNDLKNLLLDENEKAQSHYLNVYQKCSPNQIAIKPNSVECIFELTNNLTPELVQELCITSNGLK